MKAPRTPDSTDLFYPTPPGVLDSVCTLLQGGTPVPDEWHYGSASTTRTHEVSVNYGWQLLYLTPPYSFRSLGERAYTPSHTRRVQTGGEQ